MTFKILKVEGSDNLYYASRENAADCYTFAYDISIEKTNIVNGKTINNIGNAQYGSAQSLNTTLKIKVYIGQHTESSKPIDTIEVGILLKFGIYPKSLNKSADSQVLTMSDSATIFIQF